MALNETEHPSHTATNDNYPRSFRIPEGAASTTRTIATMCAIAVAACDRPDYIDKSRFDPNGCGIIHAAGENDKQMSDESPEAKDYIKILEYPNLKKIVDILAGLDVTQGVNGYQAVVGILSSGIFDHKKPKDVMDAELKAYFPAEINPGVVLYVLQVAQALWVEKNKIVPWSIKDYSEEEIDHLFYYPHINGWPHQCQPASGNNEHPAEQYDEPQVEIDATYQLFPLGQKLLQKDATETILKSIQWISTNFLHYYMQTDEMGWTDELYRDGRPDEAAVRELSSGYQIFAPNKLSRYFDERVGGCHEPIIVLRGILRSLNIPAINLRAEGHGVTYLPTIDRFVHGDVIIDHALTPPQVMLLNQNDFSHMPEDEMMYDTTNRKSEVSCRVLLNGVPAPIDNRCYFGVGVLRRGANYDALGEFDLPDDQLSLMYGPSLSGGFTGPMVQIEAHQMQAPQYDIRPVGEPDAEGNYRVMTSPIRIKSLEELSDQNTDIWE